MSKGEIIFKQKGGCWEARYIKHHLAPRQNGSGSCIESGCYETKVNVSVHRAVTAYGNQGVHCNNNQLLSFYCDEWLNSRKSRLSESSYVKYHQVLERHIKPNLGSCYLTSLTSQKIDELRHHLLFDENLAPKTVKDILIVLRSVLKFVESRFPGKVSTVEIIYPKIPKAEMRLLTHEEQMRVISYLICDIDFCKYGILLAMFTGMRIGELCALTWGKISLSDLTIKISATMQRLQDLSASTASKTKVIISPPKSDTSCRTIPIPDFLKEISKQMYKTDPTTYVLTGSSTAMEPRSLQYRFGKYMSACGISDVHFHTLRHTFATRCVESGFEIKSLSEVLGHASTTITLDRYVHSSLNLKRENMNKIFSAFV